MGKMIRLDRSGHTVVAEWETKSKEETEKAKKVFAEIMAAGYAAVRVDEVANKPGSDVMGEVIHKFDPEAKEITFVPQIIGG